jgi:elongation factor Ts
MAVSPEQIKKLRELTGAGILECKNALEEVEGDLEKAIDLLRTRGIAKADKRAGRATAEGLVQAYIHSDGKLGVLVEVNCETDFVARTDDFKELCREVAMQIAAAQPLYVNREEVPADLLEKEKALLREQTLAEGKPEQMVDKIVEGRISKYYQENCLMDQAWIKDDKGKLTINDLVKQYIAKLGENLQVRRFVRLRVGEE